MLMIERLLRASPLPRRILPGSRPMTFRIYADSDARCLESSWYVCLLHLEVEAYFGQPAVREDAFTPGFCWIDQWNGGRPELCENTRKEKAMSKDTEAEARCRNLGQKLRAMLEENREAGSNPAKNPGPMKYAELAGVK